MLGTSRTNATGAPVVLLARHWTRDVLCCWKMIEILFIEDDPCERKLVMTQLNSPGTIIHCRTASCWLEALAMLDADPHFNFVLLDLGLPGLNGIGCLRQLRADRKSTRLNSSHL